MILCERESLKDVGDKALKELKEEVEKLVKELKDVKDKGAQKEGIEEKTKNLSDSLQKIGQYIIKTEAETSPGQAQPENPPEAKTPGEKKDVEEGEVVEITDMDYYELLGISKGASDAELKPHIESNL